MPWKYSVEEVLDEDSVYTTSGTSGIKAADANNNVELNNLTNTIMTSEPYKRHGWMKTVKRSQKIIWEWILR